MTIMTTTHSIEGKKISRHLGIVTGEAIVSANLFKDFFAGLRDLVGGRSAAYENELQKARHIAMTTLMEQAESFGANAVVGVDLEYAALGSGNVMLMVSASGTAVYVE